jgi:hypothetical protein
MNTMTQPLTANDIISALKEGPCNLTSIRAVVEKTGTQWEYKTGKSLPPAFVTIVTTAVWTHVKEALEAARPPAEAIAEHHPTCAKVKVPHWSLCPSVTDGGDCTCRCSCELTQG